MNNNAMWVNYLIGSTCALRTALGLGDLRYRTGFSQRAVQSLRGILPYCLHEVSKCPDVYIWLNRDYKPLGILPFNNWTNYEDFTWVHVYKVDPSIHAALQIMRYIPKAGYFFYNDETSPFFSKKHATSLLYYMEGILKVKNIDINTM